MSHFDHLFSPLQLGPLLLKSRIAMTAHGNRLADDGLPLERATAYYEARARGGAALMFTQTIQVHPQVQERGDRANRISVWNDDAPGATSRMLERIHAEGSFMFGQIGHAGRQFSGYGVNRPPPAPSSVPWTQGAELPREMTAREVETMIGRFASTAARVRECGYDGVEIHGAHGYLVHQFLSPASNLRDDDWGGTPEKRQRFAIEAVCAARAAVGSDYVIGVRLSGKEFVDDGYTLEDQCDVAQRLIEAGATYINVSAGAYESMERIVPSSYLPQGVNSSLAKAIRARVHPAPVLHAGRIFDPAFAEGLLEDGTCDIVGLLRALVADPEFGIKAQNDIPIRKCTGISVCWERSHGKNLPISCAVNADAGRESTIATVTPSSRRIARRRIVVVGAGPAGLEAAVRLASDHEVSLYESRDVIGGAIRTASLASGRESLAEAYVYYENLLPRTTIDLHLGEPLTIDGLTDLNPDAVILATGAVPKALDPAFFSPAVNVAEALETPSDGADDVIVYTESAHLEGVGVADTLAERGHRVALVTPHASIMSEVETNVSNSVRFRLAQKRVTVRTNLRLFGWDGDTASFVDPWQLPREEQGRQEPEVIDMQCGRLIADVGFEPVSPWPDTARVPCKVFRIGDCYTPRGLQAAMWDAAGVVTRVAAS